MPAVLHSSKTFTSKTIPFECMVREAPAETCHSSRKLWGMGSIGSRILRGGYCRGRMVRQICAWRDHHLDEGDFNRVVDGDQAGEQGLELWEFGHFPYGSIIVCIERGLSEYHR